MGNKRIPEVRFVGFSGDWEERKLGEVLSQLKSGLSRMLSIQDIGLPVIRANNINNGILDLDNDIKYWYIDDPQGADTQNYLVHKNDILINFINSEAKMGTAAFLDLEPKRSTIYTTNILNLRVNQDANPYFIYSQTMTEGYKNYIKSITKPAVNQASFTTVDFKRYNFSVPSIEEQTKIGTFFKQLDDMIVLHRQELTTLQQTKQGFLQKMFPEEGESMPEIRFQGFSGDWGRRKLNSIVDRVKSYSLSRDVETKEYTGYKYIHYGDIHTKVADIVDESSDLPNIQAGNYELLKKGDLVLADASEDYQGIATPAVIIIDTPYKLVSGLHTIALRPKRVDSLFLYYLIHSPIFRKYGYRTGTGMKVFGISVTNVLEFESLLPSIQEQIQIGNFFKQLDDTIALHQRELDALKETKKAFLQKMFA